ncbi:MAG: hypothetical protein STSR0004_14420 [Peptococcaceae bacterium]
MKFYVFWFRLNHRLNKVNKGLKILFCSINIMLFKIKHRIDKRSLPYLFSGIKKQQPTLFDYTDKARLDWHNALREYDFIDRELIDYLALKILTAERRYITMLQQARHQGITAWSLNLTEPIKNK